MAIIFICWLAVYYCTPRSEILHTWWRRQLYTSNRWSLQRLGLCLELVVFEQLGRDLYRATPALTRALGFCCLIRRTAPFFAMYNKQRLQRVYFNLDTHDNPNWYHCLYHLVIYTSKLYSFTLNLVRLWTLTVCYLSDFVIVVLKKTYSGFRVFCIVQKN